MQSNNSRPIYIGNRKKVVKEPNTEVDEIVVNHDEVQVIPETGVVQSKIRRSGDMIPNRPLGKGLTGAIGGCALICLASGFLMVLVGALIQALMVVYATKQGPVLWWAGLGPMIIGIWGLYTTTKRKRKKVYRWGMCNILLGLTQTAVMGWVGNYTTSHYDVWPLHAERNNVTVCQMMHMSCFCQDYYHGAYSKIELPDVKYMYIDDIKWRSSVYDTCGHLGAITALFWVFHAAWGLFVIMSLVSCVLSHAGSICASEDVLLLEEDEPQENDDLSTARQLGEDEGEGLDMNDGRLEVVYSEFERF